MSEAKHTPGPWTIEHDREFDECIIYAEREEERVVICEVGTYVTVSDKDHSIDLKQIKANAKLLADAWQLPDLRRENAELKAINKEFIESLESQCKDCRASPVVDSKWCDCCGYFRLLKKARGERE